jgi:hypothetical protein
MQVGILFPRRAQELPQRVDCVNYVCQHLTANASLADAARRNGLRRLAKLQRRVKCKNGGLLPSHQFPRQSAGRLHMKDDCWKDSCSESASAPATSARMNAERNGLRRQGVLQRKRRLSGGAVRRSSVAERNAARVARPPISCKDSVLRRGKAAATYADWKTSPTLLHATTRRVLTAAITAWTASARGICILIIFRPTASRTNECVIDSCKRGAERISASAIRRRSPEARLGRRAFVHD